MKLRRKSTYRLSFEALPAGGSSTRQLMTRVVAFMRRHLSRRLVSPLTALLIATVPATAASADEESFKTTAVLWVVSSQLVGEELLIEAEGTGYWTILGSYTVTASLGQTIVPGCDPGTGTFTLSGEGGTIELSAEALVCFAAVTGRWMVTGGTGEFEQASGDGTFTGSPSHAGQAPVVMHLEGSLSF
jgi:hypothetical protein